MRTGVFIFLAAVYGFFSGCNPKSAADGTNNQPYSLSYGDSIIYLRPVSSGDYVVYPITPKEGVYSGFPEGIEIDGVTGAINVTRSETGLRYRITHIATDGKKTEISVVLSGISFPDKFYNLSQNDTISQPVYNASQTRTLPVTGSNFDDGNNANSGGCSVRTENGSINLAQCVRNGVFGNTPQNDSRRDFDINYRINDASGRSLNKIRVRLYYYTSMAAVAPDLLQTLLDRQTGGVFLRGGTVENATQTAKPRPPCVIIIAN